MSGRRDSGYDRQITVFSPEGKLYQIEYAFNASRSVNVSTVAMKGKDCVILATQRSVGDKLIDPTNVTQMYKITDTIGCCMTGLKADSVAQVARTRQEATEFRLKNGYDIPVSYLAARVADTCQVYTQHVSTRALGCVMLLCGIDETEGPLLFKIDPAGHYVGMKAAAAGIKHQEATTFLEKKVKDNAHPDFDQAVRVVIMALQTLLSSDLNASEIEIGYFRGAKSEFSMLSENDIEHYLTIIAERD